MPAIPPAPYFHLLLKFFRSPLPGEAIKIYSPLLWKGEGGSPNYGIALTSCLTLSVLHFFIWRSFQVAFFSRCTLYMLHFSVCSTILMLHFFYVALFSSFTFLCCRLFVLHFSVLHFFHFALSLSSTFFVLYSFCVALFLCCTFFILHSFHVAPFFVLLCFHVVPFVHSFHVTLFFLLYIFRVALFPFYTFFILNSFHVALCSRCTVFMLHLFVCCAPFMFHLFLCCLMLYFSSIQASNFIKNGLHHRCLSVKFVQF